MSGNRTARLGHTDRRKCTELFLCAMNMHLYQAVIERQQRVAARRPRAIGLGGIDDQIQGRRR
ncbi:hypothetical protein BA190_06485 [Labrys sp. WJW]|nr:hypothetical protein BA190_06485 [Labrys sp. WJW]